MRMYWIEIQTPMGVFDLWSYNAPTEAYALAKRLGFEAAYGQEGKNPSKKTRDWRDREAERRYTSPSTATQ